MTGVTRNMIEARVRAREIFISPLPHTDAFGDGTVDLRVGNLFLYSTRSSVATIDVARPHEGSRLFTELYITASAPFILQPKQFALASTLEYVALPRGVSGFLQSRSTYGRMGLVAVAAAWVAPGYRGSPTLELYNAGDVALAVTPGTPICQLILMAADEATGTPSRYQCHTRPYFAQALVDEWLQRLDRDIAGLDDHD